MSNSMTVEQSVWILVNADDAESIERGSYWPPEDSVGYFAVPKGDLSPLQEYADRFGPAVRFAIIEADVRGALVQVHMDGMLAAGLGDWGDEPITAKDGETNAMVSPKQMRQARNVRVTRIIQGRSSGGTD
jgi:hypothetical protein